MQQDSGRLGENVPLAYRGVIPVDLPEAACIVRRVASGVVRIRMVALIHLHVHVLPLKKVGVS